MFPKKILNFKYIWVIILVFACLWQGRFLLGPGFYTFSDESHLANLHQMSQALKSGQIPPRWAPNFSYNFGHPLFNFYYLLPYYFGSFLNIVFHLSLIWSLKLTFLFSIIASAIAMYFLATKFFKPSISAAVSLIYLFTPYRAVDLYVRGSVGEMFGFVFMPLALLAFINLVEKRNRSSIFFASISLFLLIISHNLTVLIFFPVLILVTITYIIFKVPFQNRRSSFLFFFFSIILSLLLSSYYLIPATFEKTYMQNGTPFNYYDHFPFIKQLIYPYWGYGASVWGPTDQLSFQIGLVNIFAIIVSFFTIFIIKNKNRFVIAVLLILTLVSIFMMNIRSDIIWKIFPIASYIQFPWRFLIITTFCTPLLIGFICQIFPKNISSKISILLAIFAIISTSSYFRPHKIMNVDDNYYLHRFFIDQNNTGTSQTLSLEYKNNSEDYLPLTIWTTSRPSSLPPKIESTKRVIISDASSKNGINYSFSTNSDIPSTIYLNNYYFPGWKTTLDNRQISTYPSGPHGRIGLDIPPGPHLIKISFSNTPLRSFSNLTSLATLLLLVSFCLFKNRK